MGKILKRCTICKKFHAEYLVPNLESGGKGYLCFECWTRYAAEGKKSTGPPAAPDEEKLPAIKDGGKHR